MEIGFGGGEHLATEAKNHPENGYIGAEPFLNGVVSLLRHCKNDEIKNIRIWPDDIRLQVSSWPNNCLDGVFIMFPDPWPKNRHASRRIINKDNLEELSRLMKIGGELRIATDHSYAKNWILAGMLENPNFEWSVNHPTDWNIKPKQESLDEKFPFDKTGNARLGMCSKCKATVFLDKWNPVLDSSCCNAKVVSRG